MKSLNKIILENETNDKRVILLSGIPGSGKSTYIKNNFPDALVCSADHFFEQGGEYKFDPSKIKDAHQACQQKFRKALKDPNIKTIVVDNTLTSQWEVDPYINAAKAAGVPLWHVVLSSPSIS